MGRSWTRAGAYRPAPPATSPAPLPVAGQPTGDRVNLRRGGRHDSATVSAARPAPAFALALVLAMSALLPAAGAAAAPVPAAGSASAAAVAAPAGLPVVAFRYEDEPGRLSATVCAEAWAAGAPQLAAALGIEPAAPGAAPDTVACLVLGTASFGRLFGGALPDWGVGVALPGGRVVAVDHERLPAVGRGVREVFLHEMVHALLMRESGGAALPTWLHEGLAMRLSGEWRFSDTVSLALEGRVPDLWDLRGPFPGAAGRAQRAYLTSELAVGRLLDEHGPGVVPRLLAAARRDGDVRAAFAEATGAPLEVFEDRFARAMRLRFGWLVMLTRWPALFVLLALVLAVAALARLARNRRRLAAMPDDDDPASVAGCPVDEG